MELKKEQLKRQILDSSSVSEKQYSKAQKLAQKEEKALQKVLVEKNFVSDRQLGQIIAEIKGIPYVNLREETISEEILSILPEEVARNQKVIPFKQDQDGLHVAMADPDNYQMKKWLEKKTGSQVIIHYATEQDINEAIGYYQKGYRKSFEEVIKKQIERAKREGMEPEDLPIKKTVDSLIEYAYANQASDIHIEPHGEKLIVRFRIDGILHDIVYLPPEIKDLIITRIKILSELRTDEHRAAQDGKFSYETGEESFDIRVSVVPITDGEKVAMRLLSENAQEYNLEDLGFQDRDLKKVNNAIKRPHGMILATGPTGSGKSTTLYSILKVLNDPEVNISTIEDPVEYDVERVNQIQVNEATGLTFAQGLRTIVRQDPDIIMVGEIRDSETAEIAVNAAMTGHLVLSTLHTNDAPTAFPRLMEMGVKPFLVASSVNLIVAQRLVRRICKNCIEEYSLSLSQLETKYPSSFVESFQKYSDLDKEGELRLHKGRGCRVCGFSGYKARIGIFEVLQISEKIKQLIMEEANASEIREAALAGEDFNLMMKDGVKKVEEGITTLDEILRVTRE